MAFFISNEYRHSPPNNTIRYFWFGRFVFSKTDLIDSTNVSGALSPETLPKDKDTSL